MKKGFSYTVPARLSKEALIDQEKYEAMCNVSCLHELFNEAGFQFGEKDDIGDDDKVNEDEDKDLQ